MANQADWAIRPPHRPEHQRRRADIAAVFGAAFDDGRGHVQAYATYRNQRRCCSRPATIRSARLRRNAAADVAANGATSIAAVR